MSNEDELKDAFRVLDKHGQGWITTLEMQKICKVNPDWSCLAATREMR